MGRTIRYDEKKCNCIHPHESTSSRKCKCGNPVGHRTLVCPYCENKMKCNACGRSHDDPINEGQFIDKVDSY